MGESLKARLEWWSMPESELYVKQKGKG